MIEIEETDESFADKESRDLNSLIQAEDDLLREGLEGRAVGA